MITTLFKVTLQECITQFDLFSIYDDVCFSDNNKSFSLRCYSPSISFLFVLKSPECQAGLCSNVGLILIFPSVDKEDDVCFLNRKSTAFQYVSHLLTLTCVFTALGNISKYTHGKTLLTLHLGLEFIIAAYFVFFYHCPKQYDSRVLSNLSLNDHISAFPWRCYSTNKFTQFTIHSVNCLIMRCFIKCFISAPLASSNRKMLTLYFKNQLSLIAAY